MGINDQDFDRPDMKGTSKKPRWLELDSLPQLVVIASLLAIFSACPDNQKNQVVECPDGYHVGGPDSTDCILDTTSHSFTWYIDTLGIYPSHLSDVAIINENDIWAVGDIKVSDTASATGYSKYNAVHWDGSEWELFQLDGKYGFFQARGIWSFGSDNIWIVDGCRIYQWDGNAHEPTLRWECDWEGGEMNVVSVSWGISIIDLYFVGNTGCIVHYDGTSFTRMESGTETPLRDIWGLDQSHVWATGFSLVTWHEESVTLFFDGLTWHHKYVSTDYDPILDDSISSYMYSVWAYGDTLYIACEGGLWKESIPSGDGYLVSKLSFDSNNMHMGMVRGNGYNDVFWLFAWGQVAHYNGNDWELVLDLSEQFPLAPLGTRGLAVTEKMIVFVGNINIEDKALIVRGYR